MKSYKPITRKSVDEFISHIANTPLIDQEEVIRKAAELGHNPYDLIDAALGSVKYEKSSATMDQPLEDILNAIYEKDPTPGKRYVVDPLDVVSPKGKQVAKDLEKNLGIATSLNIGKPRSLPDYSAVRQRKDALSKLQSISHAGHELEHQKDWITRPDFKVKTDNPFAIGHHYKNIYEPSELIREVKDLPQDEKVVKEILKQSKSAGLKPHLFKKLRTVLGPLATAASALGALSASDVAGAATDIVVPGGVEELGRSEEQEQLDREYLKKLKGKR